MDSVPPAFAGIGAVCPPLIEATFKEFSAHFAELFKGGVRVALDTINPPFFSRYFNVHHARLFSWSLSLPKSEPRLTPSR